MLNLTHAELGWLAGIIDAEGSIRVARGKCVDNRKKGRYKNKYERIIRIASCDNTIIPEVSNLLSLKYTTLNRVTAAGNKIYHILLSDTKLIETILSKIIPYIYIKQPHAKLLLKSLKIKKGTYYTDKEIEEYDNIIRQVAQLNERGVGAYIDDQPRKHVFSYAWLAGLIDGDGCISIGKWKFKNKDGGSRYVDKPYMKISLSHQNTIRYLSDKLHTGILKSGKQGQYRRSTRAVRLLSEKLYFILPKLIPHLRLKKRNAELAFEIIKIRKIASNGTLYGKKYKKEREKVKDLVGKLRALHL
ncbi:hypothetical protein KAR91_26420 [Candidatus Pacearchaeota archaeon]|nr:hypothetical protein [Candidatus Pacearchaeota archaeon]